MIERIVKRIQNAVSRSSRIVYDQNLNYEFCPRCEANLTFQKGYDNSLPYWKCLGCGEMLINPALETDSGIAWICDECQAMLNIQPCFSEDCGTWKCTECGHENDINPKEVFASDDEYQDEMQNPYRGFSDEDLLELSVYEDEGYLHDNEDVVLVKHRETGQHYIKKLLTTYDQSVYEYLMRHPIQHMPRILELFEGTDTLIVIEELIQGDTVAQLLGTGVIKEDKAIQIAIELCKILDDLHHLEKPIVHRDIKPSNVMISRDDEVWLLDVNVAKWHDPEETDDTRHMGTWNYAAPEQVGYGLTASSPKTDIYALGMLLNVMITGEFPKDQKAKGPIWNIIERCISLNADERYTAGELREALEKL